MLALVGKLWWVRVPQTRLAGGLLVKSPPQKALLLALACRADDHTWIAFPGYADLQRFLDFPRPAYNRAVRALEERRWLERIERLRGRGRGRGQTSNAYWLHVERILSDCGEPELAAWAAKQPGATWELERLLATAEVRPLKAGSSRVVTLTTLGTAGASARAEGGAQPVEKLCSDAVASDRPDQAGVVTLTTPGVVTLTTRRRLAVMKVGSREGKDVVGAGGTAQSELHHNEPADADLLHPRLRTAKAPMTGGGGR